MYVIAMFNGLEAVALNQTGAEDVEGLSGCDEDW